MAVLKIYSNIDTEHGKTVSRLMGVEPGVSYNDIDTFCESIPADDTAIDVRIHCDGGNVSEGFAIYDRLRATGKEITTIVEGTAASMATIVMLAAPKERRKAYANAHILVHEPWFDAAWLGDVTAGDLRKAADEMQNEQDRILDTYVERCGCDRAEMAALMAEDKFIGVDRAMELGLIGEVIPPISASNHKGTKDMSKKNMLNKILDAVRGCFAEEAMPVMAMELDTATGETLTIRRDDGEPQIGDEAHPDGEWLMPNGDTIVVENGVITAIHKADAGSDVETPDEQEGDEGGDNNETPADPPENPENPETPDNPGEGGEGTGNGNDPDPDPDPDEDETEAEADGELKKRIEALEAEIARLKANAKTDADKKVLNAVKIAGGYDKVFASIKSSEKINTVQSDTANVHAEVTERNYLKDAIAKARNK